MMSYGRRFFTCLICLSLLTGFSGFHADADDEEGVRKYGVVHNIAEDRQVVKVGGIYEPEGLDKYMKRRFDEVVSKLGNLENQIAKLEEQFKDLQAGAKNQK